MKAFILNGSVLSIGAAAAFLAGCTTSQPFVTTSAAALPRTSLRQASVTETVVHSFGSAPDGNNPQAGLLNVAGTLYGTTEYGGSGSSGTVFDISGGTYNVVYSFPPSEEGGINPRASLTDLSGSLYGTTWGGGTGFAGTVFEMTASGSVSVLHNFSQTNGDGFSPLAGLKAVGSDLYGTTYSGGSSSSSCGTAYEITP